MKKKLHILLTILFILELNSIDLYGSHIVGGEMTYKCLGGTNYEVRLTLRRDCFNGSPEAEFDPVAHIFIFNGEGQLQRNIPGASNGILLINFNQDDTLNEILKTECEVIGGDVCVHTTTYVGRVTLPQNSSGYLLAYQRCCRNKTLTNIQDPELTGATYTLFISADALRYCNSGPRFGDWPPIYICGDRPIYFPSEGKDSEGDSLVYSLCAPYLGADTFNNKPTSFTSPPKPPYTPVTYRAPYSLFNLLGNNPPLKIDSKTGLLTGDPDPTVTGQYLIGVCISEYRNGKLLSQLRRDFQYNVRICTTNPVAQFDPDDSVKCDGDLTVSFTNRSNNAKSYYWQFDYPKTLYTSTDSNVTFTFPKAGVYQVALIATRAKGCIDTNIQKIYLYDSTLLKADFTAQYGSCQSTIDVQFQDRSFDSLLNISKWEWSCNLNGKTFGSNVINPKFSFSDTGLVKVQLIITSLGGCKDTVTKQFVLNRLRPQFVSPSIPICIGETTHLISNPDSRFQYNWSPNSDISCANCPDPIVNPNSTRKYYVTITDGNCTETDSVEVKVSTLLDIDIAGKQIICSDSMFLNAIGGIESSIEWSSDRNFNTILKSGSFDYFSLLRDSAYFYVRGKSSANCPGNDSIFVKNEKVVFESFFDQYKVCEQDTIDLKLRNRNSNHRLSYTWSPAAPILSGQGSDSIKVRISDCQDQYFTVKAQNQFGCNSILDSLYLDVICKPVVGFKVDKNCDNTNVSFTNLSDKGNYEWDFGDQSTSNEKNPTHFYKKSGIYIVKLKVNAECNNEFTDTINVGFIMVNLNDTVLSCQGAPVYLNPTPDPDFVYTWSPSTGLDDPNKANPKATVAVTTNYKVRITDPSVPDCYIDRTVTVFVAPDINLEINKDTILCYSNKILLQARTSVNSNIEWIDQVGILLGRGYSLEKEISDSMYIFGLATDTYGCSAIDSFRVIPISTKYRIEGPSSLCPGADGAIQFISENAHRYTYNWSPAGRLIVNNPQSDRIIVKPIDTTVFYLDFVNEYGCAYRDSFQVNISKFEPPLKVWADKDTIYLAQSVTLHVTPGYTDYEWIIPTGLDCTKCTDPVATPPKSIVYTVKAKNHDGCESSESVVIYVILPKCDESDVFVPNIFSPNGDNNNDELIVRSNFIKKLELVIYDRWGEKIFETTDKTKGWDGYYKGELVAPDVYGYYLNVTCIDNKPYFKKGNVTLIR